MEEAAEDPVSRFPLGSGELPLTSTSYFISVLREGARIFRSVAHVLLLVVGRRCYRTGIVFSQ